MNKIKKFDRRTIKRYDLPRPWNQRYARAICQARYRREEWAFTPNTWMRMWENSGVIEHRGRRVFAYCMARVDKTEAWGPHNCIIVPRRKQMGAINTQHPNTKQKRHRPLEFGDDVTPKDKINRSFE